MAVVAFDWSGAMKGYQEGIWMALVDEGQLRDLRNGFERDHVAEELIQLEQEHGRLIVGFDFAFSFPAWFVREEGAESGPAFWPIAARRLSRWIEGDELQAPFHKGRWGDGPCAAFAGRPSKRLTDPPDADSCFHLQGPKQVGRGALRGFAVLASLRQAGFKVWPFDAANDSASLVVEIFPRSLYRSRRIAKGMWRSRLNYLTEHHADQNRAMLERAAGSGDSFDAAISALVMDLYKSQFNSLQIGREDHQVEGVIWQPEV
jgi:hypothetical protein